MTRPALPSHLVPDGARIGWHTRARGMCAIALVVDRLGITAVLGFPCARPDLAIRALVATVEPSVFTMGSVVEKLFAELARNAQADPGAFAVPVRPTGPDLADLERMRADHARKLAREAALARAGRGSLDLGDLDPD